MQFTIQKNNKDTWLITPNEGALMGVPVMEAEGVSVKSITLEGRTIIGTIKSIWGATVLTETVYNDMETLRALSINKRFGGNTKCDLWLDYDGFHDTVHHIVKYAEFIVLLGKSISARGVK